ncbi:MAG: ribonuclease P protein component [Prevotellaceae bacterium]|jgi:ribonuclease P protein component|nr:ribonuclease P protein component [Prevotellaceae bacterium]
MDAVPNDIQHGRNTLSKAERLNRQILIDKLFASGSRAYTIFPLRLVYLEVSPSETTDVASVLVSVSKRHFKHAVDRNRIKRQIRESYRRHKHPLISHLQHQGRAVVFALIYLTNTHTSSDALEVCVKKLITRLTEKLT